MQTKYLLKKQRREKVILTACSLCFLLLPFLSLAQPAGATINNPIVIGTYNAGTYTYTDTKNNSTSNGYQNNMGQPSDDIYYKFTVQGATTISISTCGSGFDTYLHLLNSTGGNILAWDDNGPSCSGLQSSIGIPSSQTSLTSLAAGTYYIVTEGFSSSSGSIALSVNLTVQAAATYDTRNYIKVWDATAPETNPNTLMTRDIKDVKHSVQYFDGLGRPEQMVIKKGSYANGVYGDMVSPVVYDEFGREVQKYLPYASPSVTGLYKDNVLTEQNNFYTGTASPVNGQNEAYFYSKTIFEPSPLNRVEEAFAPGNSWVGTNIPANANIPEARHSVKMKYRINTGTDDVKIWEVTDVLNSFGTYAVETTINEGVYAAGKLYKTVTTDEHGKQVIEFKDKEGKVILKKVQLTATAEADGSNGSNHTGWLCTYYIYDDLNNLRCVIQPQAVKLMSEANNWDISSYLNEQCFRYEYDQRNRMIIKKVPGAGEVYMVYDARDRLVLTQDANLRNAQPYQKFLFTQYDDLNRPIRTGTISTTGDWTVHRDYAANSTNYPWVEGYTNEIFTETFYDNYNWVSAQGNPFSNSNYNNSYDTYFESAAEGHYAEANAKTELVTGMVTGSKVKVLGTGTYLYTMPLYNDKGRVIQVHSKNITGETDIITTQYSWSGQPLVTIQKQVIAGGQTNIVVSHISYDNLGRVIKTEKKIGNSILNTISGLPTAAYVVTAENTYDALGQMKTKKLGRTKDPTTGAYTDNPIESLSYDYNIRGWVLGMNRDYLATAGQSGTTRFGFELAYDKQTNKTGQNFTTSQQYNGNITGMVWKSDGDDVRRMYSFGYDNANRLLKGDFLQQNQEDQNNTGWTNSKVNYSMQMGDGTTPTTAYDANGNIKAMTQFGWKLGGNTGAPIDNLVYSYYHNTNKLRTVIDDSNDPDTKLGDFHYAANLDKTVVCYPAFPPDISYCEYPEDYTYDVNGNLTSDRNKGIGLIQYNYLNLPQTITVANKGSISYTYDAAGNKLQKVTDEPASSTNGNMHTVTTTTYAGAFVYESKTINNVVSYANKLQFTGHEEGRIRPLYNNTASPNTITGFAYDYMIKDHLGNVRMLLTDEQKTDIYPVAHFEGDQSCAQNIYDINTNKIFDKPDDSQLSYANNNGFNGSPCGDNTGTNTKMYKLFATSSGADVGLGMTLKVMAGDMINIFGKSYYTATNSAPNTAPTVLQLLTSFLGASGGAAATAKGASPALLNSNTGTTAGFGTFITNGRETGTAPKAFINWVLFDEQFNFVKGGVSPVDINSNTLKNHHDDLTNIPMSKSGYLYIYVSNESPVAVFFDNLQVVHTRGPILEETHYYPFGLTMAGISSKAATTLANKLKYNGKEEQRQEFNDGSGLEWIDYGARMYDNQIGRWHVQDNYSEVYYGLTPYNYAGNTPINAIDIDGNLFIFANGFMKSQYLAGQRSPYLVQGKEANVVPNPKYERYAPDRGFYKDGPRNNGNKFEDDYWEGVDAAYKDAYGDDKAYYTNGSFTPESEAMNRYDEGIEAGLAFIKKLESGEIKLATGETIKIVGHSQGAAYAAGIAWTLSNSKYGSLVEFADYLSPHQPGDFINPTRVKGRQFSTESDKVSSKGIIAFLFGGSKYEKIRGAEWGKERESYDGGRGGHSVGTWLNDLVDYWRNLGIKVTVHD